MINCDDCNGCGDGDDCGEAPRQQNCHMQVTIVIVMSIVVVVRTSKENEQQSLLRTDVLY